MKFTVIGYPHTLFPAGAPLLSLQATRANERPLSVELTSYALLRNQSMINRQTEYYNQTAQHYDEMHGGERDFDHVRALEYSWPILENFGIQSVLEVGCGTGRSLQWIRAHSPAVTALQASTLRPNC